MKNFFVISNSSNTHQPSSSKNHLHLDSQIEASACSIDQGAYYDLWRVLYSMNLNIVAFFFQHDRPSLYLSVVQYVGKRSKKIDCNVFFEEIKEKIDEKGIGIL